VSQEVSRRCFLDACISARTVAQRFNPVAGGYMVGVSMCDQAQVSGMAKP
jgi:hypothetical protein